MSLLIDLLSDENNLFVKSGVKSDLISTHAIHIIPLELRFYSKNWL